MSNTARATYRFARLPEWILYHPDLNPTDCRVFCALDRFDGRDCFPSHEALAEKIGVSEDTTQRSIKRLVSVGAIRVEKRHRHGQQTSNRYVLAGDNPLDPVDDTDPTRNSAARPDRNSAGQPTRKDAARSRAK